MKKDSIASFVLLAVSCNIACSAATGEIWNINDSALFDPTNSLYPITNGCAIVDLKGDAALCPTGLGHLASGRESVKEIRILFANATPDTCWLHISWEPGGSGKEQFEVSCNSADAVRSALADADERPNQCLVEKFNIKLNAGDNNITLRRLSGDGLRFRYIFLSTSERDPSTPLLNPNLKFATLKAYEAECGEQGIMLDDPCIRLYAPARKAKEAQTIFGYLVKAYGELYRIVGSHPDYKLVIYHFPENNAHARGGTSECTIWYGYKNLDLDEQREWTQYKVPHVSGYIEEMAHNFDGAAGAQFGWEMVGWNLGIKVASEVAGNPVLTEQINETRTVQRQTFQRYVQSGYRFPKDVPANLCDRVHAHVLWMCRQRYGPDFWPDFFKEIQNERQNLMAARYLKDPTRSGTENTKSQWNVSTDCRSSNSENCSPGISSRRPPP